VKDLAGLQKLDDEYENTESLMIEFGSVDGFVTIGEQSSLLVIIEDDESLQDAREADSDSNVQDNFFAIIAIVVGVVSLILFAHFVAIPFGRQQYKRRKEEKRNLEIIAQAEEEAYYKAVKESTNPSASSKGQEVRSAAHTIPGRIGPGRTNPDSAQPHKNEADLCEEMAQKVIEHFGDINEDNLEKIIEFSVSELSTWAKKERYVLAGAHLEELVEKIIDKLFENESNDDEDLALALALSESQAVADAKGKGNTKTAQCQIELNKRGSQQVEDTRKASRKKKKRGNKVEPVGAITQVEAWSVPGPAMMVEEGEAKTEDAEKKKALANKIFRKVTAEFEEPINGQMKKKKKRLVRRGTGKADT